VNVSTWRQPVQAAALGLVSGVLAGGGAYVFLEGLDRATSTREQRPWLVWFLPVFGALWGAVHWASRHSEPWQRAFRGTPAVLEQARRPDRGVPRRQAPLVLVGTWAAHLTGASVGREGVGLQLSASLAEHVARWWRLDRPARRLLLAGALAGGFGAVFAVPWAGAVFALEVTGRRRRRASRLLTALVASHTGHAVVSGLGHRHTSWPRIEPALGWTTGLGLLVAAVAFGGVATGFAAAVDGLRRAADERHLHPVLRPVIGGVATVALVVMVGRDYLGLSLPVLDSALSGDETSFAVPVLKAVFTVLALASGFPGGEVTPLFVIGASLGAALAAPLGVPLPTLAALGMVALFAAAMGAPLTGAVMAAELFGGAMAVPALLVCAVSSTSNRRRRRPGVTQAEASTRTGRRRGPRI